MKQEPEKSKSAEETASEAKPTLAEGLDYYFEGGLMVFTAHFLRRRGYCCGNGCRHCPYSDEEKKTIS